MIKKNLTSSIILVMMLLITPSVSAQTYRQIKGWSKEVNDRLEDFLNSTITMKIRKVAVLYRLLYLGRLSRLVCPLFGG